MDSNEVHVHLICFRITVLGASNSGKTSLVNSFVNAICPQRYVRTDNTTIYSKKVELLDEVEYNDVRKPIFVEIEDTPGSERGNDDDDADERLEAAGDNEPPKIKKGSRVVLRPEKDAVVSEFNDFRKGVLRYKPGMDNMLGKDFTVKTIGMDGSYGLPSPDGSEGGIWQFPPNAVRLKVALTLPIDQYLNLGEKPKLHFENLKERKAHALALQHPLTAFDRPVGGLDMDKTITRNRMGYFICFDISNDDGDSLKEAMAVYKMLMKALEKRKVSKLKPRVYLVGCKSDRIHSEVHARQIVGSAQIWSDQNEVPFYQTSAKNHKGVWEVFNDMIQAISSRSNLWKMDGVDGEEDEDEDASGCFTS
mmetsp:Transcript_53188/g.116455  ORF Transcript_53188/g.116455 Transcript_53188/m.116455 type:complete len:364 (-) Transcript_53188:69-1160(-)